MHQQFACAQRLQVPLDSAAAQKQNLHFYGTCVSLEVLQANVHGTEFGRVPCARSEILSDRPGLTQIRHWHLIGHIGRVSGTFHEVLLIFMICTSSHLQKL